MILESFLLNMLYLDDYVPISVSLECCAVKMVIKYGGGTPQTFAFLVYFIFVFSLKL